MARSVADLALLLSVQAGFDARLPLSRRSDQPAAFAAPLARDLRGARIGWLGDLDGRLPMQRGVLDTCASALKHFEAVGCKVEAARVDFDLERLWNAWLDLRSFTFAGGNAALYRDETTRALLKPRSGVGNGARLAALGAGRLSRGAGPLGVVSVDPRPLRALRLPGHAGRTGVPVRRGHRLAARDRRPRDGYLSSVDAGRGARHDGGSARRSRRRRASVLKACPRASRFSARCRPNWTCCKSVSPTTRRAPIRVCEVPARLTPRWASRDAGPNRARGAGLVNAWHLPHAAACRNSPVRHDSQPATPCCGPSPSLDTALRRRP